jgi:hypothetical protein
VKPLLDRLPRLPIRVVVRRRRRKRHVAAVIQAKDTVALLRFDLFLFAAAATVLITRAILAATGYPQIGGGGSLHIAHVLWGGLLMAFAVMITMVTTSSPARLWSAFLGGIGFGLFVDEVGKFITKDVNYFYKPAVAVIYAVLIGFYVLGRELIGRRRLTAERVRVLALQALVDREIGALGKGRRETTLSMLRALPADPSTDALIELLTRSGTKKWRSVEELITSFREAVRRFFVGAARRRWVRNVVVSVLSLTALVSVGVAIAAIAIVAFGDTTIGDLDAADFASIAGNGAQTLCTVIGLILLRRHRWVSGLRWIRAGLFIGLLFTTVMEFADQQFGALVDFGIITVLLAITGPAVQAAERGEIVPRKKPEKERSGKGGESRPVLPAAT